MSNTSAREQALRQLETQLETLARAICNAWLVLSNSENQLGVQQYMQLHAMYEELAARRYSVARVYGFVGAGELGGGRYGVHIIDDLLHRFPEKAFHSMWRMEFEEFRQLVELLKEAAPTESYWGPVRGNPTGGRPARSSEEQIAVALFELGNNGDSREKDRIILNIGKGSIYNYTNRVIQLLLDLVPAYIQWPAASYRRARMHEQHSIFKRAVGFIDGCEIPLQRKPKRHHETYFSRHQQYGFQIQAVCDWKGRIRYAYCGNQASVQDSTALRSTALWRQRETCFSNDEYLIADKGYFTDKYLVVPYKEPTAGRLEGGHAFNKAIASERIRIEHCFGQLKARWQSLCSLPVYIGNDTEAGHRRANAWMMACVVLFNILKDFTADETWLANELAAEDLISSEEEGHDYIYETDLTAAVQAQLSHGNRTVETRSKLEGLTMRELLRQKLLTEQGLEDVLMEI